MVLAHSLRDHGTTAKLVALFTPDRLQPATITELRVSRILSVPDGPGTIAGINEEGRGV